MDWNRPWLNTALDALVAFDVVGALLHVAVSLLILAVVFVPLEKAFPARPQQKHLRPEVVTDALFLAGQYLVFVSAATAILQTLQPTLGAVVPLSIRSAFAAWPLVLQAIVVVVLADCVVYWGHRLMHSVDILWRFHAVHHSSHHLDWVAAHREHPVDGLLTMLLVNLPAFLLGFSLEALATFLVVRGMWSIFIHSNVRVRLGIVGLLFGDPVLHRWHHAQSDQMTHNYGNAAPYLDVLFGTHYRPPHEEYALGLREPWPRGYFAQLWWAFIRPIGGSPQTAGPSSGSTATNIHVVNSRLP